MPTIFPSIYGVADGGQLRVRQDRLGLGEQDALLDAPDAMPPSPSRTVTAHAARFAHTFAYLRRRPRLRRDAFSAAWLTSFAMGTHGLGTLFVG